MVKLPSLLGIGLLVLTLFITPALSQSSTVSAGNVRIDLGVGAGRPGGMVLVAITVTAPEDTPVVAFEQDIGFDNRVLSFESGELSSRGAAAGVQLSTAVEVDSDDPSRSILRVKATVARPLSSGDVADLGFRVNDDAPLDTTTVLKNQARAKTAGGRDMFEVLGKDGDVAISTNPFIFGCFFYMH